MDILIIVILIFIFTKWIYKPKDDFISEPLKITDGPKLTSDEQKENYRLMRNFLENNPKLKINDEFPEYVKDIELSKKYRDIERRFKSGELSYADYQIELNELASEIDISEDPEKKSFWNAVKRELLGVWHLFFPVIEE